MSAHVLDVWHWTNRSSTEKNRNPKTVKEPDPGLPARVLSAIQQALAAPPPTREEIALEYFLLECD
jgi:hypothetical protein